MELTQKQIGRIVGVVITITTFGLYTSTLAQGLILGDPSEYTIVAHLLDIAHPPGYAVMILYGKIMQTLIPFGTVAWRSHMGNAVMGTAIVIAVYNVVLLLGRKANFKWGVVAAAFSAVSVAWAPNHWQHSIHTNPHLITAGLMIFNIWLLLKWSENMGQTLWLHQQTPAPHTAPISPKGHWPLVTFSLLAGLGAVHHPLTVFSFPAYTLFILLVYPKILLDWRVLFKMVGAAGAGLALFAYYPLTSATMPEFGPHTMNTLSGFLDHVLARGLSDSLPYYSLAEQPIRMIVYTSILRLQYGAIGGLLALMGGIGLWFAPSLKNLRKPAVLLWVAFLVNYAFVITLKQQDIMAYIQGPNLLAAIFMGLGLGLIISGRWATAQTFVPDSRWLMWGWAALLFVTVPTWTIATTWPHISLRDFAEGDEHVTQLFEQFDNTAEGAVMLNNWEFMTPLWYEKHVNKNWPNEADVRPVFVSVADPWLPSVFNYLPGGPVYLNGYRREIVNAGFRLRATENMYQVVEPADATIPPGLTLVEPKGGAGPDLVAYFLEDTPVQAGDYVNLILAMRTDVVLQDFYVPEITVSAPNTTLKLPFTTDSHLVTPDWLPQEVVVERFSFALPHNLTAGDYTVSADFLNLVQNETAGLNAELGSLTVLPHDGYRPNTDSLLANFRQRVGLTQLTARSGLQRRSAPWDRPLEVEQGDVVVVTPRWAALDQAEESYTIFVHLIDGNNISYADLDYTPLGGAVPTHLWFPKWLPGQQMSDPYRLVIPNDLPAGDYFIEVGLYEMTSLRRLMMHDSAGNHVGDRYIAGAVTVVE